MRVPLFFRVPVVTPGDLQHGPRTDDWFGWGEWAQTALDGPVVVAPWRTK